jgi:seryl-tRNA synthetase
MLELKRIREDQDQVIQALKKRGLQNIENEISRILDLDSKRKEIQQKKDDLLSQGNQLANQIGALMKEGKKEEGNMLRSRTQDLKEESKVFGEKLKEVEQKLFDALEMIPNTPGADVPEGNSEKDNQIIESQEEIVPEVKDPLAHWDIVSKLGIIDFELGNKITGAGFPVYMREGARIQRALIGYFLDQAIEAGYEEVLAPILVSRESAFATGQLPDKDGQMYHMAEDDLFVIPTGEVPITNIMRGEIIPETELPKKFVGYTPCFRREAGSWGSHVRGLNRLHQFDKVEIVQATRPENSSAELEKMCSHVRSLLENLGLPFRILRLCGGDMGFAAAQTIDFEVFSGGQRKWLEVSSVSNFESFQSNRLKTRFRDGNNKINLVHTLNGSALALPRVLASILENYQDEKGVKIPSALKKYLPFDRIDFNN